MRPLPLRTSLQAEADLLDHYILLGRGSLAVAERLLDAAERAYNRIAQHPHVGVACDELAPHLAGMRRWGIPEFRSYLIFYREASGLVEILRVLHGARDLEAVFDAEPVTFDTDSNP